MKKHPKHDMSAGGERTSLPGRRQFLKAAATGALGAGIIPGAAMAATAASAQHEPAPPQTHTRRIEVDFSRSIGTIKALNGVNGGPLSGANLTPFYSAMGIPHVRLHDVTWMFPEHDAVNIQYVFPDPGADVNDPNSYDFRLTDQYIQSIQSLGAEITYRLAYGTWGRHNPRPRTAPPADYARWADICGHIVRHYNQGWAGGHDHKIKYWEVWNEPDVPIFWSGTPQQYYRLYEVTAKALKKVDPEIKVGGPTMANAARRPFFEGFLKHCADHEVPLDFASWHIYAKEPQAVASNAEIVHDALQKYGFSKTESVLDEWNYFLGDWSREAKDAEYRKWLFETQVGGPPGAAYVASILIRLQDSSVGLADYYQGTTHSWGGLFDEFGVPRKPVYTFEAFNSLMHTPDRVFTSGSDDQGFAVMAGLSKDKREATVLISNFGSPYNRYDIAFQGLPWTESFAYEKYVVDAHHNLALTNAERMKSPTLSVTEEVATPSVCMIRFKTA